METFDVNSLNVKQKSFSFPTLKLPKVCSKDEIKAAINASKDHDILTRDLAIVAAMGAMGSDTAEQQKLLIITEIMNAHPIALTTIDNRQHYLLGSSSTVKELASNQPSVSFNIPLPQQKATTDNIEKKLVRLHYIQFIVIVVTKK